MFSVASTVTVASSPVSRPKWDRSFVLRCPRPPVAYFIRRTSTALKPTGLLFSAGECACELHMSLWLHWDLRQLVFALSSQRLGCSQQERTNSRLREAEALQLISLQPARVNERSFEPIVNSRHFQLDPLLTVDNRPQHGCRKAVRVSRLVLRENSETRVLTCEALFYLIVIYNCNRESTAQEKRSSQAW